MSGPDGALAKEEPRRPRWPRLAGVKAATDLLTLFVGQFASKIFAFLAFVLLARQLSREDYGLVETVVGMASIGLMAVEFGSGTMGIRLIANKSRGLADVIHAVVSSRVIIAVTVVPLLALGYSLLMGAQAPVLLIVLFACSVLAGVVKHDWLFQAHDRMAIATGGIALKTAIFLVGVLALSPGANGVAMVGYAELVAMSALAIYFVCARFLAFPVAPRLPSPRDGAKFLVESAPLGLSGFVYTAATALPVLIIATIAGTGAAGEFGAGLRIVVSLVAFSWIYYQNLFPLLSRHAANEPALAAKLMRASDTCILWAGMILAVALSIAAEPIIHFTVGDNLAGAAGEFAVAIFYLPLTLASGSVRWLLIAQNRQSAVLLTQTIGMVTTLIATAILALSFGGLGGAFALLIGGSATYLSGFVAARHAAIRASAAPLVLPLLAGIAAMVVAQIMPYPPIVEALVAALVLTTAAFVSPGFVKACRYLVTSKQNS